MSKDLGYLLTLFPPPYFSLEDPRPPIVMPHKHKYSNIQLVKVVYYVFIYFISPSIDEFKFLLKIYLRQVK